jgi:hypothetical protein
VTVLFGLLALLQGIFLPGYLIARRLRLDDGLVKTGILAFGLSLVVNYHVTLLFTLLGIQGRAALCGLIALELVALWRLRATQPPQRPAIDAATGVARFLRPDDGSAREGVSLVRSGVLLLGVGSLAWFAFFLPQGFTSIFVGYDALVSWNRWAIDWMNGELPVWTLRYPQLLPANWGMLYAIAGAPLQFLPKGVSVLYPLATTAMFVDAGLRRSRPEYLLAAALCAVLMSFADGRYIASGYADLPIAFFALAPFYLLATCDPDDPERLRATIGAATVFVIGGALTKQSGLYIAALFPFLLFGFLRTRRPGTDAARQLRTVLVVAAALLLLIAPWYAYKQIQILRGFDSPGSAYAAGVHAGRTLPERAARAWSIWEAQLSKPLLWGLVLCVALSSFRRRSAILTWSIALPFTVAWALLFSYDRRNLALAFPFLALGAADGAALAAERLCIIWRRSASGVRRAAIAGLAVALVLAAAALDRGRIDAAHDRALRDLGNDEMNAFLYSYLERHGFEGRILTNYRLLSSLPELSEYVYFDRSAPASEFWPFRDPDAFRSVLKRRRGDIRYIVVSKPSGLPILNILHKGIRQGELEVLFRTRQGLIVRLRDTRRP